MTDNPQTTPVGGIKEFNYRVNYHTTGFADFRIFAESERHAEEIAKRLFYEKHTNACILDSVEPTVAKKDMNIHKCTKETSW